MSKRKQSENLFQNLLKRKSTPSSTLQPIFWDNIKVGIVCVFLASLVWFFQRINRDYALEVNYPLVLAYDTTKLIPLKTLPSSLPLVLSGHGWDLLKMNYGWESSPLVLTPNNIPTSNFIASERLKNLLEPEFSKLQLSEVRLDTLWFQFDSLVHRQLTPHILPKSLKTTANKVVTKVHIVNPRALQFKGPKTLLTKSSDSLPLTVTSKTPFETTGVYKVSVEQNHLRRYLTQLPKELEIAVRVEELITVSQSIPIKCLDAPRDFERHFKDSLVELRFSYPKSIDVESLSLFAVGRFSTINKTNPYQVKLELHGDTSKIYDWSFKSTFLDISQIAKPL